MKEYENVVKFTKTDYISTIVENKIKPGFAHEFNDPFDSMLHLSEKDIIQIAEEVKVTTDIAKLYIEQIHSIQILSLIKVNPLSYKSNLMWGHYASSGKEMAVIYDSEEVQKMWPGTFRPVKYKQDLFNSKQILLKHIKLYNTPIYQRCDQVDVELLNNFFYSKIKDWEYETEYRVITFGYIESINSIFRKYELNPNPLSIADKILFYQLRHLNFNTLKDLSTRFKKIVDPVNKNVKNPSGTVGLNGFNDHATIDIPHFDTLLINMPKPKKIILGWGVDYLKQRKILLECKEKNIMLSKLLIPSGIICENNCYQEEILFE